MNFEYGQYAFSTWQNEIAYRNATGSYPSGKDKEAELFDESIESVNEIIEKIKNENLQEVIYKKFANLLK